MPATRDHLLIDVNGERYRVQGEAAFKSLSTWLREDLRLTGTKVVCAEGDCGSCSVLLGTWEDAGPRFTSVCACIQHLFQLDRTHIITVEGLSLGQGPEPLRDAMITRHAAQCGFCTPGFVVALRGTLAEAVAPTKEELRRALVGNLCRCTGYESILQAALDAAKHSPLPFPAFATDTASWASLCHADSDNVELRSGDKVAFLPSDWETAVRWRSNHPDAQLVAGGTDLGVHANKGKLAWSRVIVTRNLPELREWQIAPRQISIGAGVTIAELEEITRTALPELSRMLQWFGSPPIKHAATIGGNLVNCSPICDTMPALMVLDAVAELRGPRGTRLVNLNEFALGVRRTSMAPDEWLVRVRVPLPAEDDLFRVYKVSQRKDLDISVFTAAFWATHDGDAIRDLRITYGGVGPRVLRLPATEAYLRGRRPVADDWLQARRIAATEITPISDVRGAAAYRHRLAENVLLKFARTWSDALAGTTADARRDVPEEDRS